MDEEVLGISRELNDIIMISQTRYQTQCGWPLAGNAEG